MHHFMPDKRDIFVERRVPYLSPLRMIGRIDKISAIVCLATPLLGEIVLVRIDVDLPIPICRESQY